MNTLIDKDNNKLIITESGVYLKLDNDDTPRQIFKIESGKIVKHVYKKNIFKNKNIGFNYHALKMLNENQHIKDKTVYIIIGRDIYTVNIKDILGRKNFLHFKKQGYELQCFYPISCLNKYTRR